ncbi:MAG: hypothetical protein ABSG97_05720 [Sedimentisphaerales bacterium]
MSNNLFSCQNSPPAAEGELPVRAARLSSSQSSGLVLLMTMVVLVVLATIGYTLATRVSAQRHRDNYVIDYTNACYARDSAIKYALVALEDMNSVKFISRPNEPDFSDIFSMDAQKYRDMIEKWAKEHPKELAELLGTGDTQPESVIPRDDNMTGILSARESNDSNGGYAADSNQNTDIVNMLKVRGPYGPVWPFVTEPVEFEIGSTTVKIEIEDENAKYPVGWAIIDNEKVQREAQAGLGTFCEWMGLDSDQIESVKGQLKQIGSIKPFKVEFKSVVLRTPVTTTPTPNPARRARAQRVVYKTTNIAQAELMVRQARDFSKLFHSSLLDVQMLAVPTIISKDRKESALKYMGLWGTTQVNINSAPRNVLEAAFTFGGDADKIADGIIQRRREKTFDSIDELKKELFRFSGSIDKSGPYITMTSSVFSIRVTASSGTAKASAVVVVLKEGGKVERVAIMCG